MSKRTVFFNSSDILSLTVQDKTVNNSYEFIEARYFFGIRCNKTGWYEHSWYETFYIGNLPETLIKNSIIENNIVYNKPYIIIKLKHESYVKKFDTYESALNYATEINLTKGDIILEIE